MKNKTILLVEDNIDDIELAILGFEKNASQNSSEKSSYTLEIVTTGEDALNFLFTQGKYINRKASDPHLILLDIKLPGISGLKVLQEVRKHPSYQQTPIVILTTSDETADILEGYNLGVSSYLQKPVDFGAFSDLLQQISLHWLK